MKLHRIMRFLVLLLLVLAATAGGVIYQQLFRQDWLGLEPQVTASAAPGGATTTTTTTKATTTKPGNAVKNSVTKTDLYPFVDSMLSKLPSPTNLDASRFDQVLGSDAGNYLRTANVTKIEVKGDLFSVELSKATTTNLNGQAELKVAKKVTFQYKKIAGPAGERIVFSKIDGVEVKATWLLGFMTVSQVELSLDAAGNTVVVVTVDTFFGKIDRTFIIGPDGKPRKP